MISIILPIYNSALWVRQTIESVMAQSFTDWELLVIDDHSEDNSLEIVRSMVKGDKRVKIFCREHGGVSAVRNYGLSVATGDFITFIDSDDIWPDYYLEYFHCLTEKYDAGIVSGKFVSFPDGEEEQLKKDFSERKNLLSEDKDNYKGKKYVTERIISAEKAVEESLYQTGVVSTIWGKLFRKELFNGIRFRDGELYEDLDVFYQVAMRCRMFVESDCPVYGYRQRKGSILHTFRKKRLTVLDVTKRICEYMEKNCPALLPAAIDRRFAANFNMLALMLQHDKITGKKDDYYTSKEQECREYIKKHSVSEIFNSRVRLKNKLGAIAYLLLPRPLFNLLLFHMA